MKRVSVGFFVLGFSKWLYLQWIIKIGVGSNSLYDFSIFLGLLKALFNIMSYR